MFEDALTYGPDTLVDQTFSELLAADLEDDARELYGRMAADITAVATGMGRAPRAAATVRTLLTALAAAPYARAAFWRRLYREISSLVAGCDALAAPETRRIEFVRPLGRLRQFLSENVDIADVRTAAELERSVLSRAAGA